MKYVAYYRTSTSRQEYGIEAQKADVLRYLTSKQGELIGSFEEHESGKFSHNRPQMAAAIKLAKVKQATLILANLSRLSRNASFLMSLQDSNLDFVALDCVGFDKFTIGIIALMAQRERELCSSRTIAGLKVAKSRGVTLGNPRLADARANALKAVQSAKSAFAASMLKNIKEIQSTGISSLNRIADCLNKRGEKTARSGGRFTGTTVKRIMATANGG